MTELRYSYRSPKTGKTVEYTEDEQRQADEEMNRILKYTTGTLNPLTRRKKTLTTTLSPEQQLIDAALDEPRGSSIRELLLATAAHKMVDDIFKEELRQRGRE